MSNVRLAIDVGGTFVDFVRLDETSGAVDVEKVPSSGALEDRFFEGLDRLGLAPRDVAMIVHGSTLVINTIVQEKGARVGLITTAGFRDVLELGRGNRAEIYNLFYTQPAPLVPRYLRYEVPERLDWRGDVVTPLDEDAVRAAICALKEQQVEGIAVCFLHAYANPAHERRVADLAAELFPEAAVSISSDIVREWREFERTSTTVLNAYAKPQMLAYLSALDRRLQAADFTGAFNIMQSSGGMTSSRAAQDAPIRTVMSGPAGGVIGAAAVGAALELPDIVSADVGGTTFDVALIAGGRSLEQSSTRINRRPVLQPTIDIVSIGAGGGSIAWIDAEGGLRIGPQSAQAVPGPACYGLGGTDATVTDAQVLLGYLDPDNYLGKRMVLDRAAAERVIRTEVAEPLGLDLIAAAQGIIHLTDMNMASAIRAITIERGHDPRGFTLMAFGGGGGLFAGALLRELEMTRALIPVNPAMFSAWGLLNADFREDLNRQIVRPLTTLDPAEVAAVMDGLAEEAVAHLRANQIDAAATVLEYFADLRYLGQEHTVRVPLLRRDLETPRLAATKARFDEYHEQAYAHNLPDHAAELVNVRLVARGRTHKPPLPKLAPATTRPADAVRTHRPVVFAGMRDAVDCPIVDRTRLGPGAAIAGPAIIEEPTSTTLVPPDQAVTVDAYGNLLLTVQG